MGLIVTPGYVGSDLILDGSIVNADVSTGAGIVLSKLATSTSSQLASIISDETGSGLLVFGTSPSFTTDIRTPKVTTSGATNLVLDTNTGTSTGNITIATGVNSNINITPNGTGSVVVASTIVNTTSNITASGANANINLVLAGKGTGVVDLGAVTAVKITGGASTNLLSTNGSGVLSWVATPTFTQVYPTSGIANSTGSAWGTSYSTTGSSTVVALGTSPSFVTDIRTPLVTTASAVNLVLNTNAGTTTGSITINTGVNGNIAITPNGTGNVNLGDVTAAGLVTTGSATANLTLNTNSGTTSSSVTITAGANGNITFAPNGSGVVDLGAVGGVKITGGTTGQVLTTNGSGVLSWSSVTAGGSGTVNSGTATQLAYYAANGTAVSGLSALTWASNTLTVGNPTTATTITTNGASNLTINTNAGTNAGSIVLANGVNGNINIIPNGTGSVLVGDQSTAGTVTTGTITANLTLNTNNGTTSGSVVLTAGTNGAIVVTTNGSGAVQLVTSTTQLGVLNTATTLTTSGTGNLTINTNNGTNAGSIVLNQGVNGNIAITPNGTGSIVLAALTGILKGTSGTVSAAAAADINSTFGSQTQNFVYAAPSGANGNPTFRALTAGDIPGTLSSLTITGNLTVNGTTTTINSNTVSVDDKNLELGGVASVSPNGTVTAGSTVVTALSSTANIIPGSAVTALSGAGTVTLPASTTVASVDSATQITLNQALTGTGGPTAAVTLTITGATDVTADGGGITLLSAATNKTIIWDSTNSNWTSSEHWNIATGKTFKINNVTVLDTSQVLASATGVTVGGTSTTTVELGTNSSTLSTTTVGGAITGNILRINSTAAGTATFTTNNASNLVINTNGGTNAGSITLNNGVNGNIAITPNGTGIVNLGDMTGAGLVTTGTITSNLTLNTNNGTTSGSIVITAGTNGNIAITPNGSGVVDLGAVTAVKITGGANGNVLTTNGSGVLSWGAGGGGSMVYPANGIANSTGTAWGTSYSTTGSSTVVALGTSPSFVTDIRTPKVTTATAVNLVLDTNAGTTTGSITINTGTNGNITLLPNGTGQVLIGSTTAGILNIQGTSTAGTATITTNVTTGAVNLMTGLTTATMTIGSAAAGRLAIAFNQASTSTTSGAVTIAGGLGVAGAVNAQTKSFIISHPTKPGKLLKHGSLEGPEFGVYVRGKVTGKMIELPDYWLGLVNEDTITVDLTPIGKHQKLYVEKIEDNRVYINNEGLFSGSISCFYTVWGERKDVGSLEIELDE